MKHVLLTGIILLALLVAYFSNSTKGKISPEIKNNIDISEPIVPDICAGGRCDIGK